MAREKGRGGSVVGGRASRKRKLRRLAAGLRLKVRKRYADESNAFEGREYRSDQTKSQLMQFLLRSDRHFYRSAAGGTLKVGPFDFTVTVRPRALVFSHQAQTSSAIAITAASI
jgi:hypothetical protein